MKLNSQFLFLASNLKQKFTLCCCLYCLRLLFARQTCAKRKLPQIPSLTHSTLLIANLRRPSSVKILEGWQLHACKLACFGPCHAIFTERSNGIANQHCIPGTVVYSGVAMNESKHALVRMWNNGKSMVSRSSRQVAASRSRSRLLLRTLLLLLRRLRLRQRL